MAETERLNLKVEPGVGDMMTELAGGERKRGQWLSALVLAMHETQDQAQASDLEQLKFALSGMIAQQKQLEGRVLHLERQVAAMMAQG